jgi:hypothetical protein
VSSPAAIYNFLSRLGFRVNDWSGRSRIPKREYSDASLKPGVYTLFYGDRIQHIGSTQRGLKGRLNSQRNAQEGYKPHGSFSWFVLPKNQILKAEALLIEKFSPLHSKRRPRINLRRRSL